MLTAIVSSGARPDPWALAAELRQRLGRRFDLTIHIASSSVEASSLARAAAATADVVIAVGGDGTVADVATGIFDSGAALAIVPAGSTNITARSLGIPARPDEAIALVAHRNRSRRIDVGRSGDRCFLHIAGAGLDAAMFASADQALKRRVGWLAYLPAGLSALRLPPSRIVVSTDGETIEARSSLILVANGGAAVAPGFRLHPRIVPDDGWLDILLFTAATPAQVAATLGRLGSGQLHHSPHLIWRRAKSVSIVADPPLAVELDGDVRGWTPREFTVFPAAVEVLAPLANSPR